MRFWILALVALVAHAHAHGYAHAHAGERLGCTDFSGHYHLDQASVSDPTLILTPGFVDSNGVALRDDVTVKAGSDFTIEQHDCRSFTITYEVAATGLDRPLMVARKVPLTDEADQLSWTSHGLAAKSRVDHGRRHVNASWSLSLDSKGDLIISRGSSWTGRFGAQVEGDDIAKSVTIHATQAAAPRDPTGGGTAVVR